MTGFSSHTRRFLATAGVAPEELEALDHPAIHELPTCKGFGIWGPTGVGKSWALVLAAARIVDARVRWLSEPSAALPDLRDLVIWVSWPEQARILKERAVGSSASKEFNRSWVDRCKEVKSLVLDDLGREQSRGEEDYACGALTEIVVHRFRYRKPIYWTSNISPNEILALYKSRLASRLLSAWPPFEVVGRDLRLNPEFLPPPVLDLVVRDGRALAVGGDH